MLLKHVVSFDFDSLFENCEKEEISTALGESPICDVSDR